MLHQSKKLTRWSGPTLKVKPYLYQRKAIRLAIKERRLGLWMEQGTGKTLVALKVIAYYWKNSLIDDCLILGPQAVLSVWESEAQKFLAIPYTINDPKPGHLNITLINYEVLRKYRKKKQRGKFDIVIADESHRIKNRNSIQSRVSAKFAENSPYALALSGTPRGNLTVSANHR